MSDGPREHSVVADTIIRHRWWSLAALAALLSVLFSGVVPLQYDFSFTSLFVGEGEEYDQLGDYLERFGADVNVVMVGVEADDLFSAATMEAVEDLTRSLEAREGVAEVASPTRVEVVEGGDGALTTVRVVPDGFAQATDVDWEAVRERALGPSLLTDAIFGDDGRHAALIVRYHLENVGERCLNGVDDDGDGSVDCEELSCRESVAACQRPTGTEAGGAACTNALDDDGDGLVDCFDEGCEGFAACSWIHSAEAGRDACGNATDDDGDGLVDCADPDCLRHPDVPRCHTTLGIMEDLERAPPDGLGTFLGGVPYVSEIYTHVIQHDLVTFVPLTGLLTAIVLLLLFRNVRGFLLPTTTVALAVVGALGLMMLTGGKLNIINSSMPTLLLVIAVADGVHILARYFEEADRSETPREAASRTMAHMTTACALTSLTSAVGFASLLSAQLPIIRSFGGYAGLGILLAYVITMLLVPPVLSLLPLPKRDASRHVARSSALSDALTNLCIRLVWEHRRATALALVVGLVLAGVGIARVEQNSHLLAELAEENPATQANRTIEAHLGGVLSGAIVLYGEPGDLAEPETLAAMDRVGRFAEEWRWEDGRPLVAQAVSLAPVVREAHAAWNGEDGPGTLPATRAGVVSLLDQLPPDRRTSLTSADYAVGHITLRMYDVGSSAWSQLRSELEPLLEQEFEPLGIEVVITGSSTLGQDAMGFMTRDLVTSLFLAVAIIMALMTMLFRSLRVGLLSMVPNLLPLVFTLATVGLLGIDMRVSTAVVFSVSLGIAVDDTIHLLVRFREELQRTPDDYDGALQRALRGAGRAILFTTLLLCIGFGILSASEFTAVKELGLLGAVTLLSAIVGDLIAFPLLLLVIRPRVRHSSVDSASAAD